MKKRLVSLVLALVAVLSLVPAVVMAAYNDVTVYVTLSDRGQIATRTDALMAQVPVTLKDADMDGKVMVDEVLQKFHETYCPGGYSAPGGWVSKLWDRETSNTLFFVNDKGISGVSSAAMSGGDYLTASIISDDIYYADWYTHFNCYEKVAVTGQPFTLKLSGCQGMSGGSDTPVFGAEVGYLAASFTSMATSDTVGQVNLSFAVPGTYYVTARGTVSDTVITDWTTYATQTVLCPIVAPVCKVIVKDTPTAADYTEADKNNLKMPLLADNQYILPTVGANGTTITWKSDNAAINAATGIVTPQKADTMVNLTATIKKDGSGTKNKSFTICVPGTLQPCDAAELKEMYLAAAGTLASTPAKYGSEWTVIDLARSGLSVPADYYSSYYQSVVSKVQEKKGNLGQSTDYAKLILALTAIGRDVTNVGGYDLLSKLCDKAAIENQGVNAAIFTLLALDCRPYTPIGDVTRQWLKEKILSYQLIDGGWAYSGDKGDPDMTAMALQALAPYCNEANIKSAMDRAMAYLDLQQYPSGGFASYGSANSCSTAQVTLAVSAMKKDIKTTLTKVNVDEKTIALTDVLASYYVSDGQFGYTGAGKENKAATEQVFRALTAYYRHSEGKTTYYDMSDMYRSHGGHSNDRGTTQPVVASAATGDTGILIYAVSSGISGVCSLFWVNSKRRK